MDVPAQPKLVFLELVRVVFLMIQGGEGGGGGAPCSDISTLFLDVLWGVRFLSPDRKNEEKIR